MTLTPEQRSTVQAITSVFETGNPAGDYGAVAILSDGAGLSYGRHQATDKSGALDQILDRYSRTGGVYAKELRPYAAKLAADESAAADPKNLPLWLQQLMWLLRKAGEDPAMRAAQDWVFDRQYLDPCIKLCTKLSLELPLSCSIVYDTCIQSGFGGVDRIRARFPEMPPSKGGEERAWSSAFTRTRDAWLRGHKNAAVRASAYRTDALLLLVERESWDLATPLIVWGRRIG